MGRMAGPRAQRAAIWGGLPRRARPGPHAPQLQQPCPGAAQPRGLPRPPSRLTRHRQALHRLPRRRAGHCRRLDRAGDGRSRALPPSLVRALAPPDQGQTLASLQACQVWASTHRTAHAPLRTPMYGRAARSTQPLLRLRSPLAGAMQLRALRMSHAASARLQHQQASVLARADAASGGFRARATTCTHE